MMLFDCVEFKTIWGEEVSNFVNKVSWNNIEPNWQNDTTIIWYKFTFPNTMPMYFVFTKKKDWKIKLIPSESLSLWKKITKKIDRILAKVSGKGVRDWNALCLFCSKGGVGQMATRTKYVRSFLWQLLKPP